ALFEAFLKCPQNVISVQLANPVRVTLTLNGYASRMMRIEQKGEARKLLSTTNMNPSLVSAFYLLQEDERALDVLEQVAEQRPVLAPWVFDYRVDWNRLQDQPLSLAAMRKFNVAK